MPPKDEPASLIPTNDVEWAKLYTEEMTHYGYGSPLFFAECVRGDAQVGDVGLLVDGEFRRLFNVFVNERHDWNQYRVPDGFEPFNLSSSYIELSDVPQTIFCSRNITIGPEM